MEHPVGCLGCRRNQHRIQTAARVGRIVCNSGPLSRWNSNNRNRSSTKCLFPRRCIAGVRNVALFEPRRESRLLEMFVAGQRVGHFHEHPIGREQLGREVAEKIQHALVMRSRRFSRATK